MVYHCTTVQHGGQVLPEDTHHVMRGRVVRGSVVVVGVPAHCHIALCLWIEQHIHVYDALMKVFLLAIVPWLGLRTMQNC